MKSREEIEEDANLVLVHAMVRLGRRREFW